MGNENVKPLSDEEIDLFIAATKLDKEKIIQNYECFNVFAEEGKLKPEACASLFGMFLPGKNSTEIIKLMFESFDTDNNGYLDFKEFLIGTALLESKDNTEAFARLFFKLSDKDKSNGVDKQELKQIIKLFLEIFKEVEQANQALEAINSLTSSAQAKTQIDQLRDEIANLKLEVATIRSELNELKGVSKTSEAEGSSTEEAKLDDVVAPDTETAKNKVNYEEMFAKLDLIVDEAYEKFDKDKKGYLDEEGFIAFFNEFESKY